MHRPVVRHIPSLALALAVACAGLGACVNSPLHNEYVDPTDGSTRFDGFAQGPSRRIEVQAKRRDTGQWVTIGVTASRTTPYTLGTGEQGYYYRKNIDIDAIGNWRCFYSSSCTTHYGTMSAEYRVLEQGSSMVTLTEPEAICINGELTDGAGVLDAYEDCAGTYRRSMRLYWYRPFPTPGAPSTEVSP